MTDGRRLRLHGTWSTVKLAGNETGGRLAVLEEELPEGPGPPLHSHPQDETYVLLDGEATIWVDADPAADIGLRRGAGAVVFVPGGVPHTYRVESPLLRLLVLSTPAGLEDYVLALGGPDAEAPEPSRERMAAVARELGVIIHGPPPSSAAEEKPAASGLDTRGDGNLRTEGFAAPADRGRCVP
jgi:quercetin dioxygenase-like cupin family protein